MNAPFARFDAPADAGADAQHARCPPCLRAGRTVGPSVLRDTETELLFKQMSTPLIEAAGLDPHSVNVVLLNDPEINAFVATGQTVYVQSGLLEATDNVNQLQGVVAHELGHVDRWRCDPQRPGAASRPPASAFCRSCLGRRRSPPAPATRRWACMMAGPAGRARRIPGLHARPGGHRGRDRSAPAVEGGHQRQGHARLLRQAAEPGISARASIPRTASTATTRCRRSESRRSSRSSGPILRGASRPTRRSRRGSSGSRPSCWATSIPSRR